MKGGTVYGIFAEINFLNGQKAQRGSKWQAH